MSPARDSTLPRAVDVPFYSGCFVGAYLPERQFVGRNCRTGASAGISRGHPVRIWPERYFEAGEGTKAIWTNGESLRSCG